MNDPRKQNHEVNSLQQNNHSPSEDGLKINGLQQVVELLRYADPAFRESLLKRLTQRDPKLASSLRKILF